MNKAGGKQNRKEEREKECLDKRIDKELKSILLSEDFVVLTAFFGSFCFLLFTIFNKIMRIFFQIFHTLSCHYQKASLER